MAITLMCPNLRCRKILIVPNNTRGTRVRCSYCNTLLMVPQSKSVPRPVTAAPIPEKAEQSKE